jgi:predicted transcriptional regulator
METKILTAWQKYKRPIFLVLGVVIAYSFVTFIVNEKLEDLSSQLELQISQQETLLIAIAQTTARNGADTVTESIVSDCLVEERIRFDSLLGRLDKGLSKPELTELERLFGRCGAFFSDRKSVMVARLSREIEIYKTFVDQLEVLSDKESVGRYEVSTWETLADQERRQSEEFTKLVQLQDKIISTLLSGNATDSLEIKAVLEEVAQAQQSLTVSNMQATEIRQKLIPL